MSYSSAGNTTQPNIAFFVVLAWLAIAVQIVWLGWENTAHQLGDTDDALRLVQVRELLAGRGWFDLHERRLQPPIGYDTHWSRLIDAGLAGFFLLFHSFLDTSHAERLVRVVWPLLWILPAMVGAVALTWRLGGRAASFVILLLLLFGLPAFTQFWAGRIDHHNVQITLALLTLATAIWSDRVRWTAWAAGALSGIALAIGFEGLPFIIVAGGIFALRYLFNRDHAAALSRYGQSLAASTVLVFLISIGPGHWAQRVCDTMALNTAAPAIIGALALHIAGRYFAHERIFVRCVAVVTSLALAAAIFVMLEPRCLGGPLALVDPAVRPIWLAHVHEVQSLLAMIRENPSAGYGIASYPVAALLAAIMLAQDKHLRRDDGYLALATAFIVAIAMTLIAIRAAPYTIWLGMPLVAAALSRLFDRLDLASLPARVSMTVMFSPVAISFASITMIETVGPAQPMNKAGNTKACLETENYAALAKLPTGVIVTDVDFGPFLLALTPHSVLGAPYHRLSYGIVVSHRAFAAPPEEAREVLRGAQATYVMTCGSKPPKDQTESERQRSLWSQLAAGNVPAWLEPIPNTGLFSVYRFKR